MDQTVARRYVDAHPDLDDFEQKYLVNSAGIGESDRRWDERDLRQLFTRAELVEFSSELIMDGLARYAWGQKSGAVHGWKNAWV